MEDRGERPEKPSSMVLHASMVKALDLTDAQTDRSLTMEGHGGPWREAGKPSSMVLHASMVKLLI
jgi:hypothetical protein